MHFAARDRGSLDKAQGLMTLGLSALLFEGKVPRKLSRERID